MSYQQQQNWQHPKSNQVMEVWNPVLSIGISVIYKGIECM